MIRQLREFLVIGFSLLVFVSINWWQWLGLGLAWLLFSLISFWRKTYQLTETELIYRSGVIFRRVRHMPFNKIQNIHRNQWFFLRPFDLESLTVDSGGHSHHKNQIMLPSIPTWVAETLEIKRRDQGEMLTDAVNQAQAGEFNFEADQTNQSESRNRVDDTYRASIGSLFAYAVTMTAVFFQFFVFLSFYGHFDRDEVISRWLGHLIKSEAAGSGIFAAALLVVAGILVVVLFNVLRTVAMYYRFTVTHDQNHLTIERGLFEHKLIHVTIDRVQTVQIHQNLLRRLFGLATVKVRLISDANESDEVSKRSPTLIPIIGLTAACEYLAKWFPHFPGRIILGEKGRYYQSLTMARNGLVIAWLLFGWLLILFPTCWAIGTALILSLIVGGAGWYKGQVTNAKIIDDHVLAMRTARGYEKIVSYIAKDKIQSLSVHQSWWLSKHNRHAILRAIVRSETGTIVVQCRYLPIERIEEIFAWYQTPDK